MTDTAPHPSSAPYGTERFARAGRSLAMATLFAFALLASALVIWVNQPGFNGEAIHSEFSVFWAAGRLALAGNWAGAFDPATLDAARALDPGLHSEPMLWNYPPLYHVLVAPLGLLPFSAAWILFDIAMLAAFAAALRRAAGGVPGVWTFALAAPAVAICLGLGQNALLTTAILVAMWEALRLRAFAAAGLLAALLSIKPQLCLLVPFALMAMGHWRAIGFGALGMAAIIGASLVIPGLDYWRSFFDASAATTEWFRAGAFKEPLMITWYAALTFAGVARDTALILQVPVTLAVLAVVVLVMRSGASHDLKGAVLLLGVPLAIPYAFYYELALAVGAAVYLVRAGLARGWRRVLPAALWAAPVPGLAMLGGWGFFFAAPLLTFAFGVAAAGALGRRTT